LTNTVSPTIQVKAAGGVRSLASALEMIDAGVTRIGATATAEILDDFVRLQSGELTLSDINTRRDQPSY
jgi:deoxyribose-phosphate aldolase